MKRLWVVHVTTLAAWAGAAQASAAVNAAPMAPRRPMAPRLGEVGGHGRRTRAATGVPHGALIGLAQGGGVDQAALQPDADRDDEEVGLAHPDRDVADAVHPR